MATRPIPMEAGPANGQASVRRLWDTELLILRGEDREGLKAAVNVLADHLRRHPKIDLADLAYTLNSDLAPGGSRLALVAGSAAEAMAALDRAQQRLADPRCTQIRAASGVYYTDEPLHPGGKIAFLFPGEGAQYLGMLGDVRRAFPHVAGFFDECDLKSRQAGDPDRSLTEVFLPPEDAGPDELARAEKGLRRIDNAMISVMIADWGLHLLLQRLGLSPDVFAGHSMGELVALWAAGCVEGDEQLLLPLVRETMEMMQREEGSAEARSVLLAVGAGRETLAELIAGLGDPPVVVAMDNCPHQAVVVGPAGPMATVEAELLRRRIICERLPFGRPYHTPAFAPMIEPVRELFKKYRFQTPRRPVYSCTTARPFPADPEAIRELAVSHWAEPVRFTDLIRNMHDDGVRLFIESGPRGNLSAFVEDILRGRPFAALPANVPRRSGLTQLNHLVGALATHNVPLDLSALYEDRPVRRLDGWPGSRPVRPVEPAVRTRPEFVEAVAALDEPATPPPAADTRGRVMMRHLEVMDRFLGHQRELTELFLHRVRAEGGRPDPITSVNRGEAGRGPARPLLGEFVELQPGRELVMRRVLDLRADRFAADHTVGGREISKVDPGHYGVPVMPMTFTLEMMAEAAAALVPGLVVTSVRDVRLYRWLAFNEESPTVVELTARVVPEAGPGGSRRVAVEVRDLGLADRPKDRAWLAAQGTVVLEADYPPPPEPLPFRLTNDRPAELTVERTYHNLFHGVLFQGVRANLRTGDEGIESRVEVLPREGLFRDIPEPEFLLDPVLLDVVLHPLAAWHLVQPDQAGRIMLPIGVESLEVFGPPMVPGTALTVRSRVVQADARSFLHQGEALGDDGSVRVRLNGVRCWRFYVPFGQVNFHGPKDQYFLSSRWEAAEAGRGRADAPLAVVRLEPPVDLNQGSMLEVTAKVTLSPGELREYRRLEAEGRETRGWLFDRNAAKDAIRQVWFEMTSERLFPSDIEVAHLGDDRFSAHRRGSPERSYPPAAVARSGAATVAVSKAGATAIGIALEPAGKTPAEAEAAGVRCARRAAEQAAGRSDWAEGPPPFRVESARDGDWVVAWTAGEREGST